MPDSVSDNPEPGGDRQAVLWAMAPDLCLEVMCVCIKTPWEFSAGANGVSLIMGVDSKWYLGIRCCLSPRQDSG